MLSRLCWRYLRRHKGVIAVIVLCQILSVVAMLYLPDLNARIIDEGVITGKVRTIWVLGGLMLAFSLLQSLTVAVAIVLAARLAMGIGRWLRKAQFVQATQFSTTQMSDFTPSSLITRNSNDVQQIQMVVLLTFSMMLSAPLIGVGAVIMALRQSVHLSMLLLVMVPVLCLFIGVLMWRLGPLFKKQQERIDRINTLFREQLTGVRVIRAFVRQGTHRDKFTQANTDMRAIALNIGKYFSLLFAGVQLVIWVTQVLIIWFGGHLIADESMQVGALIAFINYVMQIFISLMMTTRLFFMVPRASVSAERITAVLDATPVLTEPSTPVEMPSKATFSCRDVRVTMADAEEPILDHISLTFTPGTVTGIIGPTGSGKSTLINLLPRLFDVSSGQVEINGVDIRQYRLDEVRRKVALVPQTAYLFSGTIATSIAGSYHDDEIDRERVLWALDGAQAREFVDNLADGIDSKVEPGGRNFSGGQRQRLAIARALYRSADLYLFDDSLSALDASTEAKLRRQLPDYTGDAAIVVVSQKVSSIMNCDQIAVLDNGRLAGLGRHRELLDTCDLYREIVLPQLNEVSA